MIPRLSSLRMTLSHSRQHGVGVGAPKVRRHALRAVHLHDQPRRRSEGARSRGARPHAGREEHCRSHRNGSGASSAGPSRPGKARRVRAPARAQRSEHGRAARRRTQTGEQASRSTGSSWRRKRLRVSNRADASYQNQMPRSGNASGLFAFARAGGAVKRRATTRRAGEGLRAELTAAERPAKACAAAPTWAFAIASDVAAATNKVQ